VIKHTNPCGIAVGADVAEAHRKAHATDPVSAFGGVIATNGEVSAAMAEQVAEVFTEVVLAPSYAPGALEILTRKKNVRLLRLPGAVRAVGSRCGRSPVACSCSSATWSTPPATIPPRGRWPPATPSGRRPRRPRLRLAGLPRGEVERDPAGHDGAAVGIGMGQVNRVDSARLAVARAGDRARGSVAASDAFFPFPDGLEVLLDAGVRAVVQPGGSVRDPLSVEAAAAAGVPMYFTGTRHFAH
jgi:phosphoribosylaminoimidazolecarboxamide formyltransferase/IMP cyclohydrolase